MAEPPERRAAPPPPTTDSPVEDTAATAGLVAIGAVGTTVGIGAGAATTAKAATDAAGLLATATITAALLLALDRFFRRKQETDEGFLRETLEAEQPDADPGILRKVVQEELRREEQFQRRQRARIERDLTEAAREPNTVLRARRIQAIMEREKRFMLMRERMMLTRSRSAIEREVLKQTSPLGAYWRLSPHVREHTLDCLLMGGRFWPWSVLDIIHPPMHPGCPCMLYGRDEAIRAGWMRADDPIPDDATALHDAQRAIEIAHERERRLREAHDQEHPLLAAASLDAWVQSLGPPVYQVGGAVRDSLLGVEPKDVDYVAVAPPEEIRACVEAAGGRADELVVRDRLVGVRAYLPGVTPDGGVEIVPPRVEHSTGPGRHDFAIEPHPALAEGGYDAAELIAADALRRDFTINALYRSLDPPALLDPTGHGLDDLRARDLRTTHPDSFREDPLRILRAARFVARGFAVTDETYMQMCQHADAINALTRRGVSGTARDELNKLLLAEHPGRALRLLRETGALARLLPEFEPSIGFDQESRYHSLTVEEHIFRVVEEVARQRGTLEARLGALFHDTGKPAVAFRGRDGRLHYYAHPQNGKVDHADAGAELAEAALSRLGYPRRTVERVATIVREHMLKDADRPTPVRARRLRARLADDLIEDIVTVRRADMRSKGEDDDPVPTPGVDELEELIAEAAEQDAPRAVRDLEVNGADLLGMGYRPGPAVGDALRGLLAEVVDQPKLNDRAWLLGRAGRLRRKLEAAAGQPPIDQAAAEAIGRAWVERHVLLGDEYDAADYERAIRGLPTHES